MVLLSFSPSSHSVSSFGLCPDMELCHIGLASLTTIRPPKRLSLAEWRARFHNIHQVDRYHHQYKYKKYTFHSTQTSLDNHQSKWPAVKENLLAESLLEARLESMAARSNRVTPAKLVFRLVARESTMCRFEAPWLAPQLEQLRWSVWVAGIVTPPSRVTYINNKSSRKVGRNTWEIRTRNTRLTCAESLRSI